MATTKFLIGLTLLKNTVLAGEWQTTGGQFCIDKCKYHDDNYYFYWCHVSDPAQVYSDGSALSWWGGDEGNNPGTKLKWDYCIPSELEADDSIINRFNFYLQSLDFFKKAYQTLKALPHF